MHGPMNVKLVNWHLGHCGSSCWLRP